MNESIHGNLVTLYGVGILIVGKPGTGKSQLALELLDRGHQFVVDDLVCLFKQDNTLHGKKNDVYSGCITVRDIGLINLKTIYPGQLIDSSKIHCIVELVAESNEVNHQFDPSSQIEICDILLKRYTISVSSMRPLALLVEHIAKRLKFVEEVK